MKARYIITSCLFVTIVSCVRRPEIEAIDSKQDATFTYLASRRGMTALRAGGQHLGEIGTVYALQVPTTRSGLESCSKKQQSIIITPYAAAPKQFESSETEKDTGYQIQDKLASHIATDLKGEVGASGASISGIKNKLKDANIKFSVTRRSAYEKVVREEFKRGSYTGADIPDGAAGLLVPVETLEISNFSYRSIDASSIEGKIAANYLEKLKAELQVKNSQEGNAGSDFGTAASTIIAIRPLPLVFKR